MAWAEIGGIRILHGTVVMPYYGAWVGDVVLADVTAVPAQTTLVIGDLTLFCTVFRQLTFGGTRSARLVGGYGGWQKTIVARSYNSSAGVPLATVLADAAADCGEVLGAQALQSIQGQSVGTAYVRESAPGARVLKQLGGAIWWVDNTGSTQLADRAALPASGNPLDTAHLGEVASPYTLTDYSGGKGKFTVAHETPSDWVPGRQFTNPLVGSAQRVSMVTHMFTREGRLRTDLLTTVPV